MATGRYGTSGASTQAASAVGNRFPSGASSAAVSEKEDLANFISMITRDETPFMSSIGKTKATGIYHEWQTDELKAPGNSRVAQGADFDAVTPDGRTTTGGDHGAGGGVVLADADRNRSRLGNYTQINAKTVAVSGTKRAVDQAGVADEYAYQLKKRGTELRRDVEFDMIHSMNTSNAVGTQNANARSAGGYQAFINSATTVDYVGEFQAPSAATTGAGTDADGTAIARSTIAGSTTAPDRDPIALTNIDSVMQKIYEQGGKASKIMLSPKLRRDFSDLMVGDTGVQRNIDDSGKLRQSVDIYMSDFGDLMVVPNYVMGLTNNFAFTGDNNVAHSGAGITNLANFSALIYDPMWFAIATLRPLAEVDVGQQGDSTKGMMVEESTLEVRNPLGCGAIYGLE